MSDSFFIRVENQRREQKRLQRAEQQRQAIVDLCLSRHILLLPLLVVVLQYEPRLPPSIPCPSTSDDHWIHQARERRERFLRMRTKSLRLSKWGVIPGLGKHAVHRILTYSAIRTFNQLVAYYFFAERHAPNYQHWLETNLHLESHSAATLTTAIRDKMSAVCDSNATDNISDDDC